MMGKYFLSDKVLSLEIRRVLDSSILFLLPYHLRHGNRTCLCCFLKIATCMGAYQVLKLFFFFFGLNRRQAVDNNSFYHKIKFLNQMM